MSQFSIRSRDAFLALLTGRFNRKIVGYAVSWHNDRALVLQCLERALATRGSLHGTIHHTDADVRYIYLYNAIKLHSSLGWLSPITYAELQIGELRRQKMILISWG